MNEGKSKEDHSKQKESARMAFRAITEVLHEIEGEKTIDLNRQSNEPWAIIDQKGTLERTLQVLKAYINYLDPKLRKQAEGMIIRAEIYIAAH